MSKRTPATSPGRRATNFDQAVQAHAEVKQAIELLTRSINHLEVIKISRPATQALAHTIECLNDDLRHQLDSLAVLKNELRSEGGAA